MIVFRIHTGHVQVFNLCVFKFSYIYTYIYEIYILVPSPQPVFLFRCCAKLVEPIQGASLFLLPSMPPA